MEGFGVLEGGQHRKPLPHPRPLLGHHDAVLGVAGLVAHRAGETGPYMGRILQASYIGQVLGALVIHAADAIAVNQHGEGAAVLGFHLAYVQRHAVHQASGVHQELASRALDLFGGLAPVEDEPEGNRAHQDHECYTGGNLPFVCVEVSH